MPARAASQLTTVAAEARTCRRCPLYKNATQTVFGEGPAAARIMLVGEQPGDQEDLAGRPFVGPAGKILDRALAEAGIDRKKAYLTNAVKHFKNEPRGKKRLHKRPDRGEIEVCRYWLGREIALVQPDLIVALGVTAAETLAGRRMTITRERGRAVEFADGRTGIVTIHPSSILRQPDDAARHAAYAGLVKDLELAVKLAA
jgi:uracil-DNA glycosylase family protein